MALTSGPAEVRSIPHPALSPAPGHWIIILASKVWLVRSKLDYRIRLLKYRLDRSLASENKRYSCILYDCRDVASKL